MSDLHKKSQDTESHQDAAPHQNLEYDFGFNEYDQDPDVDYTPLHVTYTKSERDDIQRHLAFVEKRIQAEVGDVTLAHVLLNKVRTLRRDMHKLTDQQLYYALDGYMM